MTDEYDVDVSPKQPAEPDQLVLLDTGGCRLCVDGRTWNMRLPKLGEYRKLRGSITQSAKDAATAAVAGDEFDEIQVLVDWVRTALNTLADRPFDLSEDDWPSWLIGGQFSAKLIAHWRDVPLGRG